MGELSATSVHRRQFIKKSIATMGMFAGAGTLLSSCGGNASADGKTLLTVMYSEAEIPKPYRDEFEQQNPDIKVKLLQFDQVKLNAMLVAGTPPDIVRGAGVTETAYLATRGLALDLNPYLEKSELLRIEDLAKVNDAWRWDGSRMGEGPYYGITKDYSQDATLWYNTELFDQANVPYPSEDEPLSYDALLELAQKLTVREKGLIRTYGFDPGWANANSIMQMISQQGSSLFDAELKSVDFTTPQAKRALQWYIDYARAHVGPSPLDPSTAWAGPLFAAGRLAIAGQGYWFGGYLATSESKEILDYARFAPAPRMGSKRISDCFYAVGAWIPVSSPNIDAAWRFMEYFMGGKPAEDRASGGWGLPALKSLEDQLPQKMPYQQQVVSVTKQELEYLTTMQISPYVQVSTMQTTIDKYLQFILKGQSSLDGAAEQITIDINRLMQQNIVQFG